MSDRIYIPLRDVARVCVLTEHTLLTRFWPDHWGVPHDWRMVRSAVIVNQASLPALVDTLAEGGQAGTAGLLRKWIEETAAEERLADFVAERSATPRMPSDAWWKKGQYE